MPMSFETFVENLEQSGLLTKAELREVRQALAERREASADAMARELIRRGKLTPFQAARIYRGNPKGLVLGNYVIVGRLGKGGMGVVYKAKHKRMDRLVALKVLPAEATRNSAAVQRFQREARAAAKLEHPNIVTAFDADEADGIHFLVMQYVDGSDLAAVVNARGPLSVSRAVDVVLQAARGLGYAHSKGVIHRDIKPGNLLIDEEGTVKVLDMGLARFELLAEETSATQIKLTSANVIMGTVEFMAPEQAENTHAADSRSDIYSLGCVLYYLLTGNPVFRGDSAMQTIMAHLSKPIPKVTDTRPDVPEKVQTILGKMLAKSPVDRYQTMAEVVFDLEHSGVRVPQPVFEGMAAPISMGRPGENYDPEMPTERSPFAQQVADARLASPETGRILSDPEVSTHISTPPPRAVPQALGRGWLPIVAALILVGGGILLGQFVIRIRNRDNSERVVQVPNGSRIEVEKDGQTIASFADLKPDATLAPAATETPSATNRARLPGLIPNPEATPGAARWQTLVSMPRNEAYSMAVSPDGQLVAIGTQDGLIRIQQGPRLAHVLLGHRGIVHSLAWSPDGKFLASSGGDGHARLWSADGAPGPILKGHTGTVVGVSWSPKGDRLVTAGAFDQSLRVWSTDGKILGASKTEGGILRCVAWSPAGELIACGSEDASVQLWSTKDGARKGVLHGHTGPVLSLSWSPDGRQLASSGFAKSDDGPIRVWNTQSQEGEVLSSGDAGVAHWIGWSPRGDVIAAMMQNGRLILHDAKDVKRRTQRVTLRPTYAAWAPDGSQLFDGAGRIWKIEEGQAEPVQPERFVALSSVSWDPRGQRLAVAGFDGRVRLWNADGTPDSLLAGHMGLVSSVAWSPDGKQLASSGADSTVRIWNVDGTPGPVLNGHQGVASSVCWSPDGKRLASSGYDGTIRFWDATGAAGPIFRGNTTATSYVSWSPDGQLLASSAADGKVRLFKPDATPGPVLTGHNGVISTVAWKPDSKQLASSGFDGTVRLWQSDGTAGPVLKGHSGPVTCVAWSGDGRRLASTDASQSIRLWLADGSPAGTLDGHERIVNWLAWHPKSHQLASVSDDATLRTWDGEKAEPAWLALVTPNQKYVTFSARGQRLHVSEGAADELVYLVENDKGAVELLPPDAFDALAKPAEAAKRAPSKKKSEK